MNYNSLRTMADNYLQLNGDFENYSVGVQSVSEQLRDNPEITTETVNTLLEGGNIASTLDSNKTAIGVLALAAGISALSVYNNEYDFEE